MNQTKLSEGLQTVYVVDDGEGAREIGSALEAAGRRVEAFPSTELFLSACRSDWTGCLVVDTAVRGMGGLRLQAELNRRGCLLPVIMTLSVNSAGPNIVANRSAMAKKPKNSELLSCGINLEKSARLSACDPPITVPTMNASRKKCVAVVMK